MHNAGKPVMHANLFSFFINLKELDEQRGKGALKIQIVNYHFKNLNWLLSGKPTRGYKKREIDSWRFHTIVVIFFIDV